MRKTWQQGDSLQEGGCETVLRLGGHACFAATHGLEYTANVIQKVDNITHRICRFPGTCMSCMSVVGCSYMQTA